jgi:hypothetical protein
VAASPIAISMSDPYASGMGWGEARNETNMTA